MKQYIIIVWVSFILFFAVQDGNAQMVYDTLQLGELEILAYKADYSSTVKKQTIDTLFLDNLGHNDLGHLLSTNSPVYIRSYGNGSLATASFRGTGSSHTQVLWNDFTINSPMLGQSDFSQMPVSFFNHIDIYFGGASLQKSIGGLGGSINLNTRGNDPANPKLYFTQQIASFRTFGTMAGVSLGTHHFNSDTRVMFRSSVNDFSYYNDAIAPPEEMNQRNASFRNGGFSQQFSYSPANDQTIKIASWTQWNQRELPPVMSKAYANENLTENENTFFSRNMVSWTMQNSNYKLEVKAAWFYEDFVYSQDLHQVNGQTESLIYSKNTTNGMYGRVNYQLNIGKGFELSTGLNIDHDRVRTNNYSKEQFRNSYGVYGNLEKTFIERIKLSVLLRTQLTDGDLLPVMPLLGLNLRMIRSQNLYLRASISRNYHLPTLNDLYWNPGGNLDLDPEDGYEFEAGLNYILAKNERYLIKTDLTGYATRVNNWIQWIDNGSIYWSPENIKLVYSRGFEYTFQLTGTIGLFQYTFHGNYTYTRTTNISDEAIENGTDTDQLIYIPKHTTNLYLKSILLGYFLDWNLQYIGKQNTIGGELPAFMVNDVSIGKALRFGKSNIHFRFKVNNIFNADYQTVTARPMPGRNYELLIKYKLNH